jgi:hypothetical protein
MDRGLRDEALGLLRATAEWRPAAGRWPVVERRLDAMTVAPAPVRERIDELVHS